MGTEESTAEGTTEVIKLDESPSSIARLVVVEILYHQNTGNDPLQFEHKFVRQLKTDEQVYQRKTKIGSDKWTVLDTGWIVQPSMVVVTNDEGKGLQTIPDELESKAIKSRILKVAFGVSSSCMLVPPGESIRFYPEDPKEVVVRCCYQEARCTITVLPS